MSREVNFLIENIDDADLALNTRFENHFQKSGRGFRNLLLMGAVGFVLWKMIRRGKEKGKEKIEILRASRDSLRRLAPLK